MTDFRVGFGYDSHRLVEGRKLIIGGVEIPFAKGLSGHSDGDVLLHAVIDALLGACGLPDIGELFPDTEARYKDADSKVLLAEAVKKVRGAGFVPNNLDCVIHAELPKMSAFKRAMAECVAELIGLAPQRVSVKAKTSEGLGLIGQGEALAATVVATVVHGS